jgi:hypothetical protein
MNQQTSLQQVTILLQTLLHKLIYNLPLKFRPTESSSEILVIIYKTHDVVTKTNQVNDFYFTITVCTCCEIFTCHNKGNYVFVRIIMQK